MAVKTCMKPPVSFVQTTGQFYSQYEGLPLKSCVVEIPVTQEGSGTPSPENIRDFIGVSGVNIGQTSGYGEYFQGLLNGTYGFIDLGSLIFGYNTTYLSFYASVPNIYRPSDVAGRIIGFINLRYPASTNGAISAMDDKSCLRYNGNFWIKDTSFTDATAIKTSLNGVYLIYELETPTTPVTPQDFATLCQAFGITGNTYQITFGQTVYGGEYDARTGVLTVTHKYFSISHVEYYGTYGVDNANLYYCTIPDYNTEVIEPLAKASDNGNITSNIFSQTTGNNVQSMGNNEVRTTSANVPERFYFRADSFTDVTDFNSFISNTPIQVVAELATPQTIQLPPCPIDTLLGENNVWADTGNTSLEYLKAGR